MSFLGMYNAYRRLEFNFAQVAALLNVRTENNEPCELDLNVTELDGFQKLKGRLIFPPILALPRRGLHCTLDTDAYDYQIDCAFFQQQPNGEKLLVGHWSRNLSASKKGYSFKEKKRFAVVWSILTLRPNLYGDTIALRMDQRALKWIST